MSLAKIQQRIDSKLKDEAESILKEQGIKPSQAIVMLYKEITKQRGFPFLPSRVPNAQTKEAMREARKGAGVDSYKSAKDMFKALDRL